MSRARVETTASEAAAVHGRRDAQPLSSRALRRLILDESYRAGVGHIGSALSVVDILAALFGSALRGAPGDPDRDRFLLGKGHAALALYAALHLKGLLARDLLGTYCAEGSMLGVHPSHRLPGIDFSTGSLGHALPVAVGAALAARMQGSARRIFALLSDAECNEGSTWEAAMFAGHHRLERLAAIVDLNGQQALGRTAEILDQSALAVRWHAFGWQAQEVDGHDPAAIAAALDRPAIGPLVILAHTVSGRGVSFMEGEVVWHYLPMSDEQYRRALADSSAQP